MNRPHIPAPDLLPRLYRDLAEWFPLLTPPEDYAEEAALFRGLITEACVPGPARTPLDLGCGGGHNASHLKAHFRVTLVDVSPQMLAVSRMLNPECEHVEGDVRTLRLGRVFDAVLAHDAFSYLRDREGLAAAVRTAFAHCAPGGVALFVPDFVRESFAPGTDWGGSDAGLRGLRYLEWRWDPDPSDDTYVVDMAYLLRDATGAVQAVADRHVMGLFTRETWVRHIEDAGFAFHAEPFVHSELEPGAHEIFVGWRPGAPAR